MIKHPLYPRGNIYLSGGMQYAKNLGSDWRVDCAAKLKAMQYYPIDIAALDKEYTKEHGHLYLFLNDGELLQRKSNIRKQIIYTDIQLVINDSDALIILYDESVRRGAGTISECQTAYNRDIPLFLVNTYKSLEDVPGWLQALTTKMFDNFDDLYTYLEKLPPGILKRDAYGNHHTGTHYLCSLCGDPFEKGKTHFVSKVSPLYCKSCVEVVKNTYEAHADRYDFFVKYLEAEAVKELTEEEPAPSGTRYQAIEQARELAKRQLAFLRED